MIELILFGLTPEVKLNPLIQNVTETQTVQVEPPPREPTLEEVNDPNNCEPAMYWAKEAPYYCIPKPTERRSESVSPSSSTRTPVSARTSSKGNLYESGQCVWYIKNLRPELPNTWRSAKNWLANAKADGWATGSTPRVNAVGVRGNHVVLITSVNDNGTVNYTDMNGNYVPYKIGSGTKPANYYQYIY